MWASKRSAIRWKNFKKFGAKILRKIACERGEAESAFVLLPLLTLFLIAMQISIAVHGRNMEKISIQSDASRRALSGDFHDGDEFIHIGNSGTRGGIDLLVTHKESRMKTLLGDERSTQVDGLAIVENQR